MSVSSQVTATLDIACWSAYAAAWMCLLGRIDGWNMGGEISSGTIRRLQFYNDQTPAEAGSAVTSICLINRCISKLSCFSSG